MMERHAQQQHCYVYIRHTRVLSLLLRILVALLLPKTFEPTMILSLLFILEDSSTKNVIFSYYYDGDVILNREGAYAEDVIFSYYCDGDHIIGTTIVVILVPMIPSLKMFFVLLLVLKIISALIVVPLVMVVFRLPSAM